MKVQFHIISLQFLRNLDLNKVTLTKEIGGWVQGEALSRCVNRDKPVMARDVTRGKGVLCLQCSTKWKHTGWALTIVINGVITRRNGLINGQPGL